MKTLNTAQRFLLMALSAIIFLQPQAFAQPPDEATRVEAVRLKEQPLVETVPLTGSVNAERQSRVSTQVEGLVHRIAADIGDHVQQGDLLVELDPELTGIDLDRARAELKGAEAELQDRQRRLTEAQNLESGAIAASEIRTRQAQVKIQESTRDAAHANVARLEAELERHRVRAPYSGIVSARLVDLGEWVAPGDTLVDMVAVTPLRVHFQVPQRYYPQVDPSATMNLRFDAYPDRTFNAAIHRKVPLSESGARTFLLRVTAPEEDITLIPGMSASGALRLKTGQTGIAVPRDALIRYPDGRVTVWVVTEPAVGEASSVREQQVETGMSSSGWVEIRSGLEAEDVVITRGNEALQEGQQVLPESIDDHGSAFGEQ